VLRISKQRKLTNQIWVSADGRVMADGDELGTLFEDGSVVKTNKRRPWSLFDRVSFQIRSHPKDRHPYTLVDGTLRERLAAHREQVERFEKDSPVVVVESMTEHFATRLRDADLRISRQRPEEIITVWVTVSAAMAFTVACIVAWASRIPRPHRLTPAQLVPALVFALLGFAIALIPVGLVMATWVAPWLVRLRPGAPIRPAAAWIALAKKIPEGTVEDT
jgi:hypothetical protein